MQSEAEREKFVVDTIRSSDWHMNALKIARERNLANWAISAGFIRNAVWDRLHGYEQFTPLNDVDLLYYDVSDLEAETDWAIEDRMKETTPDIPWSVRNQARMHLRNKDEPYASVEDALRYWLETVTAVALSLDSDDNIRVIAPYGLKDLVEMCGVPTASGRQKPDQYMDRMTAKNWPAIWPKVTVEHLEVD